MKNKQKTQPTKKRILMYYLILAACLLVIAAITVGVVFGVKPASNGPTIDVGQTEDPPQKDPDDDPSVDTSSKYDFITPVKSVVVSQANVFWHNKTLDIYHQHEGMDFECAAGTEVLAAVDGTIKRIYTDSRLYGAMIEIEHENGIKTVYKFVEPNENLRAGATVNRGDVIAKVAAATGVENADGDHLHFEVYQNSKIQNPDTYLKLLSK
ncbi:MAG: M23 family metallopeptidase [Clostridia bacterium]|nr:M23 family metallopeptidase [Clostridia bacterium]